jgi:hypothetical protein
MSFPLTEDDVRSIVQNELRADHSRCGYREDALLWSIKLHENRGMVTAGTIVAAAKEVEAYVYGEVSK